MSFPPLHKYIWLIWLLSTASVVESWFSARAIPQPSSMQPANKKDYSQVVLEVDHKHPRHSVPDFPGDETGSSPFFYCPESEPDKDLFQISKIVLNPNPPIISHIWVFHAHGYFREEIADKGFNVHAHVWSDDGGSIEFTIDKPFCDFVDVVEMDGRSTHCPPYKGNSTIHKFEFIDWGIGEANYSVKVDVTSNNKRVFCIQAWFDLLDGW